jgi:hypothetical protein
LVETYIILPSLAAYEAWKEEIVKLLPDGVLIGTPTPGGDGRQFTSHPLSEEAKAALEVYFAGTDVVIADGLPGDWQYPAPE